MSDSFEVKRDEMAEEYAVKGYPNYSMGDQERFRYDFKKGWDAARKLTLTQDPLVLKLVFLVESLKRSCDSLLDEPFDENDEGMGLDAQAVVDEINPVLAQFKDAVERMK